AYQISQYDEPLAEHGTFEIQNPKTETSKKIGITRVHLEEDTGKLTHTGKDTLVDFNRSSVPLVEIVTEPDFDNAEDVKIFLEELHTIIRYLDVSDANMEEGSMRMEPNISLSIISNKEERMKNLPNYKVEVKNINSFNFAKKAIDFELIRQTKLLDKGETPPQETRGYDDKKGITFSQRSKEEAQDYRYFPEPDIPPMVFVDHEIEDLRKTLPELPHQKVARYIKDYDLKYADAFILTRRMKTAQFFDSIISDKTLQNIDILVKSKNIQNAVANAIINKRIPTSISQEEFLKEFIALHKPIEVDSEKLTQVIDGVIAQYANQVEQYKGGKVGLIGFFIGQVMKEMKGQADPQEVHKILLAKLQ
ncbi:Asp-tRNA(Asn)/Glu-tRNA(Gln) amidotransferase GatCAB subunit B, partial [Candidatus Roizmanbacteria bacterium CG_4_10_14_0_2_um_filter_39_13]